MVPAFGFKSPSSAFNIVLLPAPFGPSRPTAPVGNSADTSESAHCRPYATLTFSKVAATVSAI